MTSVLAAYLGSLVPALGWTLANFLWQGALVALVLEVLLKTSRTAIGRHNLALGALILMAVLPVATFALLKGDVRIVLVPADFPGLAASQAQTWENAAVAAWLTGVALLALRTAGGLLLVERLRRTAQPLPPAWAARCRKLQMRMAGSLQAVFVQSQAVTAPLVAGWLKPMVLIPAAALVRVPADQLEALILHELAHVRRLDAFANLLQAMVETALFYHPAVWWVSRRIRVERENCCDDLAVAAVQDRVLYVRALQAMEALRPASGGLLAANGGDLKARAARILGLADAPAQAPLSRLAAVLVLSAAAAALTHGGAVKAAPTPLAPAAPMVAAARVAAATSAAPAPVPAEPRVAAPEPREVRIVLAAATPLPTLAAPQTAPVAVTPPLPAAAPAIQLASVSTNLAPVVVTSRADPAAADLKIRMRGSQDDPDQLVAVWPDRAYQIRTSGRVTLRCLIDAHGLAERCEVAAEVAQGPGLRQGRAGNADDLQARARAGA